MMKKPSKELIEAFLSWFADDPHSTKEDHYADKLTHETLSGLAQDMFIEFFFQFARDGGMVQSGGHRTAPLLKQTLETQYEEIRNYLLQPFSDEFDEVKWLERIDGFKGFGKGIATIYLNRIDKNRFAILNDKAIDAMKLLGVDIPAVIGRRYAAVRDAEKQLLEWYPELTNFYRVDALTHFLIGEKRGQKWADELRGNLPTAEAQYWIIAAGEGAELWDDFLRKGIIRVGWEELSEDLSSYRTEERLRARHQAIYPAGTGDFKGINDFVNVMKPGDRLFVKLGMHALIGYGEVLSNYQFDDSLPRYRHLRRVRWEKAGKVPLSEGMTLLPRKTLTPVDDKERADELISLAQRLNDVYESPFFSEKAFALMKETP